jgi:uncharacterized repeat protein (TIGR01451 family)
VTGFAAGTVAALVVCVVAVAGPAAGSAHAAIICPPPPCVDYGGSQIVCPYQTSGTAIVPCGCPIALAAQAIPIPVDGCADLAVTETVDKATAVVGDRLTYSVEVRNAGLATAPDVTLADPLPAGLALVSSTGSALGALGPGEAATATVVARATQPGEIANTVTASTSAIDLDPSNNQATATTHVDPAKAGSPPRQPAAPALISSWCSASGDVCYGRVRGRGPVRLGLTLAARYFKRYMLCVTAPGGSTKCHRFRVHHRNPGTWGSIVRWRSRFPDRGPGTYRATWTTRSGVLGPAISFTRR